MSGEIIPFGKYKGQPIEALAGDPQYVAWLLQQDWFRVRFAPPWGAEGQNPPPSVEKER
jgi:hypothetical protein